MLTFRQALSRAPRKKCLPGRAYHRKPFGRRRPRMTSTWILRPQRAAAIAIVACVLPAVAVGAIPSDSAKRRARPAWLQGARSRRLASSQERILSILGCLSAGFSRDGSGSAHTDVSGPGRRLGSSEAAVERHLAGSIRAVIQLEDFFGSEVSKLARNRGGTSTARIRASRPHSSHPSAAARLSSAGAVFSTGWEALGWGPRGRIRADRRRRAGSVALDPARGIRGSSRLLSARTDEREHLVRQARDQLGQLVARSGRVGVGVDRVDLLGR